MFELKFGLFRPLATGGACGGDAARRRRRRLRGARPSMRRAGAGQGRARTLAPWLLWVLGLTSCSPITLGLLTTAVMSSIGLRFALAREPPYGSAIRSFHRRCALSASMARRCECAPPIPTMPLLRAVPTPALFSSSTEAIPRAVATCDAPVIIASGCIGSALATISASAFAASPTTLAPEMACRTDPTLPTSTPGDTSNPPAAMIGADGTVGLMVYQAGLAGAVWEGRLEHRAPVPRLRPLRLAVLGPSMPQECRR